MRNIDQTTIRSKQPPGNVDQCRAGRWPHQRYGRTIAFTPTQVEQIRALSSVTPAPQSVAAESWGRVTRGKS